MHLVVDGYGADRERLEDADLLERFLDEYPESLGMTKMVPPQVYTYHGQTPKDWGLSGFVLIAESHISIHTFPDRKYVNIDIFSCRDFDTDASRRDVEETFGLAQVKVWILERGLEYLNSKDAYSGMVQERINLLSISDIKEV